MKKKNKLLQVILLIIQGVFVGVGAILPGISGGTLCYAFGMYRPLLEVLSNPIKGLKKHWFKLVFFIVGCGVGFVGLSGAVAWLLGWNEIVVRCVFAGLIFGTLPSLWKETGEQGRNKFSYLGLIVSFISITALFVAFGFIWNVTMKPSIIVWIICGLFWGLGFIIPGFSSSTLLLFFGIYEKMSYGISVFDFSVLIPLGIAMLATILFLSKVMKWVFDKFYPIVSHCVFGFVLATTIVMLFLPPENPNHILKLNATNIIICIACVIGGAVVSYFFTLLCDRIKEMTEEKEENNENGEA